MNNTIKRFKIESPGSLSFGEGGGEVNVNNN
jgi:hypothetical protein